jgi:hypothetical protein
MWKPLNADSGAFLLRELKNLEQNSLKVFLVFIGDQ